MHNSKNFKKFQKPLVLAGLAHWPPPLGSLWTPPVSLKCAPVRFWPVQCWRIPNDELDSAGHMPDGHRGGQEKPPKCLRNAPDAPNMVPSTI